MYRLHQFEFISATRIIFGPGTISTIGKLVNEFGMKALVISGLPDGYQKTRIINSLNNENIHLNLYEITSEPTLIYIQKLLLMINDEEINVVVSIGGGSAIDTGKAISIFLTNPGDPLDYLEVVGNGMPFKNPPIPFIAIPTTSGTGSEVTKNAVLGVEEAGIKVSLRSPLMLPKIAIIDPELTYDLPANITASTGLDALTQVIEPFVSHRANPLTDAICKDGIVFASSSIRKVFEDGNNQQARYKMSLASLMGGLALANAGLGAVHGFAGPLGGMFKAPHGELCARLLPNVMRTNIQALIERAPENDSLERYTQIARLITGNDGAVHNDGVVWLDNLVDELKIPRLASFGLNEIDIPDLVDISSHTSSMKGNPIELTKEELAKIVLESL